MAGVLKIRNPGTGKFEDIPAIVGPAGKGFPAGGATGQVLKKVSDNDYDAEWSDAATGNVASVNGKTPDASGTVTLSATDVGAASAESVSALKNDKLDKTATAADSSKLGGKTLAEIMLTIYPVGAVYISANSTSPASLFGGTWESIGGRFLLGADATYTAGSTGGEATHTLAESELPVLNGSVLMHGAGAGGTVVSSARGVFSAGGTESGYESAEIKTGASSLSSINFNAGEGGPHNNMPPYLAVYMWKRVS